MAPTKGSALRAVFSQLHFFFKNKKSYLLLITCSFSLQNCAIGPDPIKPSERLQAIDARLRDLHKTPRPVTQISLSESIARAVRYNLSTRVQAYQAVLENTQIDLANMAMMPDLLSNSGYRFRNPEYQSRGPNGSQATIAEQQNRRLQDLTFSWSLLDFGLSYFRARQQSDRAMIAIEQERKTRHQIVQDTIIAWYRAQAERNIREEYDPILIRVNKAINQAKQIESLRIQEPMEALGYQREVLDTIQNIESWKKDLAGSEYTLATMIGLESEPGIITGEEDINISSANLKRSKLQGAAITKRADIEIALYETRISNREALIALLELAPIPSFTLGNNYDSNSYLVYNQWMSLGGQVAANVAKLARFPAVNSLNKERSDLARQKAVAVLSAAFLQVDIALAQLIELEKYQKTSEEALKVSTRIAEQVHAASMAHQIGELQVVKEDLRAFLSKVRRDIAKNEEKSAGARLMASVGVDFAQSANDDIPAAARQIRSAIVEFQKGQGVDIEDIAGSDLIAASSIYRDENEPQKNIEKLKKGNKNLSKAGNPIFSPKDQLRGSTQE